MRAGINLPKSSPGDVLLHMNSHSGDVEPYDNQNMDYNELQPARLEAIQEQAEQSEYSRLT